MRIGFGYDVHRLAKGRRLILGGVAVPYEKGLDGHSDADVLLHAVIDALMGAAGMGDIGRHFPPTDPAWKDASSVELHKRTGEMVYKGGFEIINIDSTIVCQSPRLADFIPLMTENISKALGIEKGRVNVKAKTEEGLGFTGRGEGISSYAVSLIEEKK
ncbi:MAG: 2-C-methyl-D-erythritol 2,4-cyclodiphosphate synthase [Deltaproteobacteria bacterium]|nr:2-C-methyl-D-erythritol 2,4-cyclodiphosphate synthase [Deltaproteobacteria bacterium]